MSITGLRNNEQYYMIPQYTMKCRLYPNKEAARKIDDAIYAIQSFYNCTIWEIYNNFACTNAKHKINKETQIETEEIIHFVDFKKIGSVEWKKKMITEHPVIANGVSSAITCKSGIIADMKKAFGKCFIEGMKPPYYGKVKPRRSYSYQETFNKVIKSENNNVFYFNLAKIGNVKVRGWNQRVRFGLNHDLDFVSYAMSNPKKQVTVTVSKDNCGDYWICFKLQNVYKPMTVQQDHEVGVDVGVKDIAICSDGKKYENKQFKKVEKKHVRAINRRMSRRQGWENEEFRAAYKLDPNLKPSKLYEEMVLSNAKLQRKIARKREYYNHHITTEIVANHSYIAVETLNVSGMYRNRHLANALSNAAMGTVLSMLHYKSDWYDREIHAIGRWTPSSKRCSCCGYILPKLPLSVREWTCPRCKVHHDRDYNASENIRYYSHVE